MSCLSVFRFSNFLVKSERGTDSNNHRRRMRQRPAAVGQSCLPLVGSLALSSFFTSAAHKGVAHHELFTSESMAKLSFVMTVVSYALLEYHVLFGTTTTKFRK